MDTGLYKFPISYLEPAISFLPGMFKNVMAETIFVVQKSILWLRWHRRRCTGLNPGILL